MEKLEPFKREQAGRDEGIVIVQLKEKGK